MLFPAKELDYPAELAGLGIGGLPSVGHQLVVMALGSLAKDQLRLPCRLVIDGDEAGRWVTDENIATAHFHVKPMPRS